ncbi:lysosomal alpha-glucosidase-like [Rhopalosiphum padi]|uniref:lysosomal alpha-glucosidase-like n=1 Tax=Rhopalosiphum padi TaxID=40932 RepID=UPI00298E76AE|nr:lysosomal alpha-glucosidase-like [Rhopalosiphum padi]XP_060837209.1 lysosomal alpha-glucosidase-like [Rhopalosiphum padi]
MKQKTKSKNSYEPIVFKNSADEDPKCNKNTVISLLSIFLLTSVLLYLYLSDNKNVQENSNISSKYLEQETDIDTIHNHVADSYCSITADEYKFDCFPRGKADKQSCEKRNCCWSPSTENSQIPWCYYSSNYSNYKVINVTTSRDEIIAFFNITANTIYKNDIKVLCMEITLQTAQRLRVKIYDPENKRYEPPYPEVPVLKFNNKNEPLVSDYIVKLSNNKVGFAILRKSDNLTIFDSRNIGGFIYSDQFIQLSALLPTKYIYGLGEHRSSLLLDMNWKTYTFFNHDSPPTNDMNGYGSHPFYLLIEKSGKSHGVFLFNSNAMDIVLQPTPAITYRTIGGILDFYYFMGPTPSDVISQYTDTIGKPFLPSYWTLGFHLCRFGQTLKDLINVHNRTVSAGIPWDTHWNDIDYMKNRNDFTLSDNFTDLPKYVNYLHEIGMHHVIILDPGVSSREPKGSYPPYDDGLKNGLFIKNSSGLPLEGQVWNLDGGTVFPDFTNPKSIDYWINQVSNYHNIIPFDGLWIDMNEPSNFVNGDWEGCMFTNSSNWENPQYTPSVAGGKLNYKTICMSANQHAGLHYDVHNLYGFSEAITTQFALSVIKNSRPLVISRSSFAGLGHFAGHWTGDVFSTWDDMKQSITDIVLFNMFGVPLVGADICGFNYNTTVELCSRWSQLGAFYPFSRNHNSNENFDQDPVALGPLVIESAKKALLIRYSLLPYLYSLFWKAHIYGETVARPLFFEYPYDNSTYNIDTQFLWGSALLISPVLKENQVDVDIYLPNDIWYDYYSKKCTLSNGSIFTVDAPKDTIPLKIRGGYILPVQDPATTTTSSRKNSFGLLIAPNKFKEAFGYLFWDDGDSLNVWENGLYNEIHFKLNNTILLNEVVTNNYSDEKIILQNITVFGILNQPKNVQVNGVTYNNFYYNTTEEVLYFSSLNLDLNIVFNITWT